jgi:hypothetical protein
LKQIKLYIALFILSLALHHFNTFTPPQLPQKTLQPTIISDRFELLADANENLTPQVQPLSEASSVSQATLAPIVEAVVTPPITISTTSTSDDSATYVASDPYEEDIIMAESGGNIGDINSIGCIGLMQDCDGNLAVQCPDWQTDPSCQIVYFTTYMQNRYGSWEAAWAFHQAEGWW